MKHLNSNKNDLVVIYLIRNNDANALIHYAEALKFYEDLSNKKGAGIIYNNMGSIHLKCGRYSESITCYKKAIESIMHNFLFILFFF